MDRELIIRLAREAGVKPLLYDGKWAVENLDVFAALVAAHERKQALAEPEQEPFGYFQFDIRLDAWVENRHSKRGVAFYTAPTPRKPLTDQEIINIGKEVRAVEGPHILPVSFARAIERAHGIGGEG